jgi:HK97 gp10 family phage protein
MARRSSGGGFIVVMNRIPALIAFVEAESRSAPKRVADKILSAAKRNAPVVTGKLVSSGHADSESAGKEATVTFDASYAVYVELGTYKMAPRFFLSRAVDEYRNEFELEMGKGLFAKF